MKKLLFLFLMISSSVISQTLYRSDYIETFDVDWSGLWFVPIATTNYYTNASVSPTTSAVLYGSGNGTSAYESDWYSFPNLVVNPNNDYYLTFRLASYRFTSNNATRGVDAADYITVQLSTNGGVSYVNELRITGASNAFWNYNSATYTKTANGTLTTIGPAAGGDRTSTGDGYSVIRLNIPPNTSNIAIDIFARANSAGEEWWMDNFELHEIVNTSLPIELIYFEGKESGLNNLLYWSTSSEHNNDYFTIERSNDGEYWEKISNISGSGNSTQPLSYTYLDPTFKRGKVNYYRLSQTDFDGLSETFNVVSINNSTNEKKMVKILNINGQEVTETNSNGVYIEVYDDGTMRKIIR